MPRGNSYPKNHAGWASSRPTPLDNHRYISPQASLGRGRYVSLGASLSHWGTCVACYRCWCFFSASIFCASGERGLFLRSSGGEVGRVLEEDEFPWGP